MPTYRATHDIVASCSCVARAFLSDWALRFAYANRGTRIRISLAAASLAALIVAVIARPAHEPVPPVRFAERWASAPKLTNQFEPKTVRTERILPPMLPQPPSVLAAAEPVRIAEPVVKPPPPARAQARRAEAVKTLDICERHGMRKVTIGKRWRCRR